MTNLVTRYRIEGRMVECAPDDSERVYADWEAVEAPNGEWVKWEDVKPLLRAVEPPAPQFLGLTQESKTAYLSGWRCCNCGSPVPDQNSPCPQCDK
jgi:hypothetical protein